jgi:signal recognition particle subunit SRP54
LFENLTERLGKTLDQLRGRGRLTEDNVRESLREVRVALLEADVALPVVKTFMDRVRERAVGQEVLKSLTPGQELIRVVRDELTELMGQTGVGLSLNVQPPAVVLVAGLQGAGKTTTVGKLARYLKEKDRKKVLVASCDVYRPAAIDQLRTLAGDIGVGFHPSAAGEDPVNIAESAIIEARRGFFDVLLLDTAGRLHVDEKMMDEIRRIHAAAKPAETLFVIDSMAGQDAVNVARAFDEALPLTGVVLTKTDGDARGGAALSVRHVTGKPIKFIGTGEKSAGLEAFHPDRMASRILGMGDVLGLIEEVEQKVDRDKAEKLARKLTKGKQFDLEDFAGQIREMRKMGGIGGMLDKIPGMAKVPQAVKNQMNDGELTRLEAIINSMTFQERRFPGVIKGSRKRRIAAGSGTRVQDVNRLLKQFTQMQKMMKRMRKKGGMARLMRGAGGGMGGGLPPGFPG